VTGGGDGGGFVDVGMNVAPGLPEVPPHALAAIAETAAEPFSIFRRDMRRAVFAPLASRANFAKRRVNT